MARQENDEGTVLLSTLLVLSLMSAVAIALLASLTLSTRRTADFNDHSQVDLYTQGAEDFARAQLAELGTIDSDMMIALSQAEPITLPFENGLIRVSVSDGTHCLRLSGLTDANGVGNDTTRRQFADLLTQLEVNPNRASRLAAAAVDWVDNDQTPTPGGAEDGAYLLRTPPHRTADSPLQSVAELRSLDGMDEELFQRLRPFVCLGTIGSGTRFNINTASPYHAPVLAALIGLEAQALQVATALIEERPDGGYSADTLSAAPALLPFDDPGPDLTSITFAPDRVHVEAIVQFGSAERVRLFGFEGVDRGAPRLTYEDWGWDTLPPQSRFLAERFGARTALDDDSFSGSIEDE